MVEYQQYEERELARLQRIADAICGITLPDRCAMKAKFIELGELMRRDLARMEAGERLSLAECWQVHRRCIALMELGLQGVEDRPNKIVWLQAELVKARAEGEWLLERMEAMNGNAA
jgi:hypothetical protein